MAKLIMNTRMNIPKSALFLELGWEPVYTFMNRQRVAYYARFQNLADDRLCKVIFSMLKILRIPSIIHTLKMYL